MAWAVGDGGTILQWQSAATLAHGAPSGWMRAPVKIRLRARAGTLPVWQTRWRVDGGRWHVGKQLALSRPGIRHVEYYSVDTARLHEVLRKLTVRIRR